MYQFEVDKIVKYYNICGMDVKTLISCGFSKEVAQRIMKKANILVPVSAPETPASEFLPESIPVSVDNKFNEIMEIKELISRELPQAQSERIISNASSMVRVVKNLMDAYNKQIKEVEAELADVKAKLAEAKKAGTKLEEHYCPYCGATIRITEDIKARILGDVIYYCPNCGSAIGISENI